MEVNDKKFKLIRKFNYHLNIISYLIVILVANLLGDVAEANPFSSGIIVLLSGVIGYFIFMIKDFIMYGVLVTKILKGEFDKYIKDKKDDT